MNLRPLAFTTTLACAACISAALAHDDDPTQRKTTGGLGTVRFGTSCNAEAQTQFERALAMLHSFWFTEAGKQFEAVLAKDPNAPSPTGASR